MDARFKLTWHLHRRPRPRHLHAAARCWMLDVLMLKKGQDKGRVYRPKTEGHSEYNKQLTRALRATQEVRRSLSPGRLSQGSWPLAGNEVGKRKACPGTAIRVASNYNNPLSFQQ